MDEQRLIDGEQLFEFLSDQLVNETGAFSKGVNKGINISRSAIHNADAVKPIDPETLPIVRQLREELARVAAERDAAVKDADNARQSLLMAMFAKCEFFAKFDSFGKSVQIVRRTDEEEAHP